MNLIVNQTKPELLRFIKTLMEYLSDSVGNKHIYVLRVKLMKRENLNFARLHILLDVYNLLRISNLPDIPLKGFSSILLHPKTRIEIKQTFVLQLPQETSPLGSRIKGNNSHILLKQFLNNHLRCKTLTTTSTTSNNRVGLKILNLKIGLIVSLSHLSNIYCARPRLWKLRILHLKMVLLLGLNLPPKHN